jgi:Fumarylacetoacetase N-terminal
MMIPIVPVPADSDFSLHNLPFGVFSTPSADDDRHGRLRRRCATRLGDTVIDLSALEAAGLLDDILLLDHHGYYVFCGATHLNRFLELPKSKWLAVRQRLQELFNADHAYSLVNENTHPHGRKLLTTPVSTFVPCNCTSRLAQPVSASAFLSHASLRPRLALRLSVQRMNDQST